MTFKQISIINSSLLPLSTLSASVMGQEFYPGVVVCVQTPGYPKFAEVIHLIIPEDFKLLLVTPTIIHSITTLILCLQSHSTKSLELMS